MACPERSFLGTLPGPGPATFLSLLAFVAFPALHRRAHRGASARPYLVQCKARTPGLRRPPGPGARAPVPRLGWPRSPPGPPLHPTPGHPHPGLRSWPCSSASSLASPSLNSADPSYRQPSSISPTSSSPLLEFDSSSPRNRICTKAATPNLDFHTPLRFVF